ncbi:hypothetical protein, partial [Nocardioides sp.]|uniref:hypothetical protein n=1 Tax=Nocardioides sp. TaxID=35761 RepID=UPI002EDAFCFF
QATYSVKTPVRFSRVGRGPNRVEDLRADRAGAPFHGDLLGASGRNDETAGQRGNCLRFRLARP